MWRIAIEVGIKTGDRTGWAIIFTARSSNYRGSFGASSGLLSSENGGMRQSNVWPSSRSNRKVPL